MKAYLLKHGEVVTTAEYLGEAEDMQEAKEEFFDCVSSGDTLACCDDDADPLYTDQWGFVGIDGDYIIEEATLFSNDGSIEGIPESADIYFWSDDNETWYYRNGEEWDGNYDLTPSLLEELIDDMEREFYDVAMDIAAENNYAIPMTVYDYIDEVVSYMSPLDAFNLGLELKDSGFENAKYIRMECDDVYCHDSLLDYIDGEFGISYFCDLFNQGYALNDDDIVFR